MRKQLDKANWRKWRQIKAKEKDEKEKLQEKRK